MLHFFLLKTDAPESSKKLKRSSKKLDGTQKDSRKLGEACQRSKIVREARRRSGVLVEVRDAHLYSGRLQKAQAKLVGAQKQSGKLAGGRGQLGDACRRSWMPRHHRRPLLCLFLLLSQSHLQKAHNRHCRRRWRTIRVWGKESSPNSPQLTYIQWVLGRVRFFFS